MAKKVLFLVLFMVLISYISVSLISADTCYCDSCASCMQNLTNPVCSLVFLTRDITYSGSQSCIGNSNLFSNKVFDCDDHSIVGNGNINSIGISINSERPPYDLAINNVIQNCTIKNFGTGVFIQETRNNQFINNTITNNLGHGFWIKESNDINYLYSNQVCHNNQSGGGYSDIYSYFVQQTTYGEDNYCEKVYQYSDSGVTGRCFHNFCLSDECSGVSWYDLDKTHNPGCNYQTQTCVTNQSCPNSFFCKFCEKQEGNYYLRNITVDLLGQVNQNYGSRNFFEKVWDFLTGGIIK